MGGFLAKTGSVKKGLPPGKPLISGTFPAGGLVLRCIKITKKIDLILTKSIGRLERNMLDMLHSLQNLCGLGVESYFG